MGKTLNTVLFGIISILAVIGLTLLLNYFLITQTAQILDADSMKCDWIFCEFSKTIKGQECYQNGELVDCKVIDKGLEKWVKPEVLD